MLLLGVTYTTVASQRWERGQGGDAALRWQQVHYVLRGIDPNLLHQAVANRDDEFAMGLLETEGIRFFEALRLPQRAWPIGEYPPFAYGLAVPLHWPPDVVVADRWFMALSLAAWVLVLLWAAKLTRAGPRGVRCLGFASVFGMVSYPATLAVANYGVVVMGALVASMILLHRQKAAIAGICIGFAMVKPTLAAPFLLVLLCRRSWWVGFATACTLVMGAGALHWLLTGVAPWESQVGASSHLASYTHRAGGVIKASRSWLELPEPWATYGVAAIGLLFGCWLLWWYRSASPLLLFAIAGVIARISFYHRGYDNLLLTFLLQLLLLQAIGTRPASMSLLRCWMPWIAMGITLWLPGRIVAGPLQSLLGVLVWVLLLQIALKRAAPLHHDEKLLHAMRIDQAAASGSGAA
ncbi:glycosyltransferase family 87 protein [Phycisphaera mikurensis]|uniref:glycosyltransferase family 87 protein n=1 Tax=Phycisphaera mikurensis TaxID=547188 RepID=UPI0014616DA2|nr:glycosyltransferase family 87 protein [Phycisphaera mikurensis]